MNGKPGAHPWRRSLVAGLVFALAALGAARPAGMQLDGIYSSENGEVTVASLFAGVFLTGLTLWWWLVARPARATLIRGGATGVLVACLAYPVVLFLAEFAQFDWQSRSGDASLLERLTYVLELSGFAIVTTGFAATAFLSVAGILIALVQARLAPRSAGEPARRGIFRHASRALGLGTAALAALLLAGFFALTLLPARPLSPTAGSVPATTHAEALAAFARLQQGEAGLKLHPRCGSILLTHGRKVARVVVFLHGLTNCPAQADELAPWLFALGYNVLVPRLPGHGEADQLTLALADVTAEDFVQTGQSSIDLAQGLGDEVIVMGLSAGGTVAAHLAQRDGAVDTMVSVAPFLAPGIIPSWAAQAATNLLLMLPNMMVWWDPRAPYSAPPMDYAYPRFATHALAQVMRLGRIVSAEAKASAPAAQHLGLLINDADLAVNNTLAREVAARWGDHGSVVDLRVVPQSKRLPHDLIDPRQSDADTELVYPTLRSMISPGGSQYRQGAARPGPWP